MKFKINHEKQFLSEYFRPVSLTQGTQNPNFHNPQPKLFGHTFMSRASFESLVQLGESHCTQIDEGHARDLAGLKRR